MQHDSGDQQQHADCCHRPAKEPEGDTGHVAAEWSCRWRRRIAALNVLTHLFEKGHVRGGEHAETNYKQQETHPDQPSRLGPGRGDLTQEAVALLYDLLDVGV